MSPTEQSFESHAKMVPAYHYVGASLTIFPTLYFLFLAVTDFSVERLALFLFCTGAVVMSAFTRTFPLGVQDRVIRLEERLRMERLFPDDLKPRIDELRMEHLIGLRFASDEELPDLGRRVLDGDLSDRKQVKQAIKKWRADHARI